MALLEVMLPLFSGAPLLIGGLLFALPRQTLLRHVVGTATLMALLGGGLVLLGATADGTVLAHQIALWPGGVAIPFVADAFSSLMLVVTGVLSVVCFIYMMASGEAKSASIASFVLILAGGVSGALLTADLFNLFVFIEVMLLPSYGLLVILSRRGDLAGSRLYVTVNLLASTLFLAGVGLLYAIEGTVNLAELAGAAENPATAVAAAVCLGAIAVKAAIFPVHGWLTRTYTAMSPAVAALFSGLHTKVAVYIVFRIVSVVFEGDSAWTTVILLLASVTLVVGALAALGERELRSLLIFQMVSGVGFILVGIAFFTPLGVAAAIVYMVHHMVVMGALLLVSAAIEQTYGTGALDRVAGLRTREPLVTAAFVVGALSLAGLPPFSGFLAKYALVLASADAAQVVVAVLLVAISLVTLMSMLKVWADMFNGKRHPDVEALAAEARIRARDRLMDDEPVDREEVEEMAAEAIEQHDPPRGSLRAEEDPHDHRGTRIPLRLIVPSLVLAGLSIALGLGGETLVQLAERAADGLVDTSAYIRAVIGR
ncbi:MAG: monovalent cation/H+ antiporter subunit D family protein [Microcella sp.]|uniref:monovalent cation/H+ antiporter subunit D family protein n=1 Tax=Microcella sp. TaxID=1913979 RepID=UPI003314D834